MSYNSFGRLLRVSTFGESHGPAIGCMIDGVPPNIAISEDYIQQFLDKRKPGTSTYTTQRRESDRVTILSGVFEGVTTGTSIGLIIHNEDTRSKDYNDIKDTFRPGHADYTYQQKYGVRDYRGGGRSSARETAMRVAAGAIAHKILAHFSNNIITITGYLTQIGDSAINRDNIDYAVIATNPFFCPDASIIARWEELMRTIRKNGSSVGAVIEVVAHGVPVGLGAPIYAKLDADLASAMMSINAVKAVEIGDGMAVASLHGEDNADIMSMNDDGCVQFASNHAGGILGGISTGQDIIARFAVKPTSSILIPQPTINADGTAHDIITKGRHDPCVGIRGVPVGEAMMALTLADHFLMHKAQCG